MPAPFFKIIFCGSLIGFLLLFANCQKEKSLLQPSSGMTIRQSVTLEKDTFWLNPLGADSAALIIVGNDLIVDFNGAVIRSKANPERPDLFQGTGIRIIGKNIQLRNATVRGFKVGIMAIDSDSLQLVDLDCSYNFRQHLKSTPQKENEEDWMSFHHNENDEWLRYGAGVYLKNCQQATVKNLRVTGGQNGLLLVGCNQGLFYNNTLHFNSGLGIGLYRSSDNWIGHNRLDWNIRGFSFGQYNRGQDSAGILVYEQSSNNIFAYNSATHSGDGFFLWAGQSTMDSGEGGCNNNLVYGNDFSHASNNGVEITFSSNNIIYNRIEDCHYGIWGGYSHHSLILGNHFKNNEHGIAIEHGQSNVIRNNLFEGDDIGIKLFTRKSQPDSWGFAKNRNVDSKDYEISGNVFLAKNPLQIYQSQNIKITDNAFDQFEKLLTQQGSSSDLQFSKNRIYPSGKYGDASASQLRAQLKKGGHPPLPDRANLTAQYVVAPQPDGMDAMLPKNHFRGRQYMLISEWGPYDFQRPAIWLRQVEGDVYTFAIFGPQGNWQLTGGEGFAEVSQKRGAVPATLVATRAAGADRLSIELDFFGTAGVDEFGRKRKKGAGRGFGWENKNDDL